MKKVLILLGVAALFVATSSCGTTASKPKSEADSVAYALGIDVGKWLKGMDSTVNVNMFAQAIKDVIGNKAKLTDEDAMAFLNEYFMVRKPAKTLAESEAFLTKIEKDNKNVKKTESGLLYEIIAEGGEKPTNAMDTVEVNYLGTLPNGEKFDSSYDRNEPATFPLNGVIPGWTEGLQLVGKGGKIKLWIPSELAYGAQQRSQQIGPNQALVFEIELLNVTKAADTTTVK
ncbi:MAG: FKBP-type peptidyl-prolyl cis-trans isomerase [Rikenellaceae bacterium]|jgi:FKBP-type peptidyl-prolyl cis-trans isomerase|nr:FKBP-type peptidyl-prolyl cis-trans isomerase [Rikenellaceae bacterium]